MLRAAQKVLLIGIGASGLVAKDLAYKLLKIGIVAISETDMHVQLAAAQALGEQGLLLAISFSGERREINLAAEEAQYCGTKVLALTRFSPTACSSGQITACIPFQKNRLSVARRSLPVPHNTH